MNKVITSDDLHELKTSLKAGQTVEQIAKVWRVPSEELEELARDVGYIELPPLAPDHAG